MTATFDKLSPVEAAYINHYLKSRGYLYLKWDNEQDQLKLTEDYTPYEPLHAADINFRNVDPAVARVARRIYSKLEQHNLYYYPKKTPEIRSLEAWVNLCVKLGNRGFVNEHLRKMKKKEIKRFRNPEQNVQTSDDNSVNNSETFGISQQAD